MPLSRSYMKSFALNLPSSLFPRFRAGMNVRIPRISISYGKAFVHEEEDGSMLAYGCRISAKNGVLSLDCAAGVDVIVYNLKNVWSVAGTDWKICGVGKLLNFNS